MKKLLLCLLIFCGNTYIINADTVILGGDSIGIVGEYDGLYISGTYSFTYHNKSYDNNQFIKAGDILTEIENKKIETIEDMQCLLKSYTGLNKIKITLWRKDKTIHTSMYVLNESKEITYGLYIKDKIMGIGTMTYYHPKYSTFACLGHYINDSNNNFIQKGTIYSSTINSIQKAQNNITGSKLGTINYDKAIGIIEKNSVIGVYGSYNTIYTNKKYIETAKNNEVQKGVAYIYTTLKGNKIQRFKINIKNINFEKIEFEIIDSLLIKECGGIIHGMSGSPIIQNGKLVGAVTHVLVNDPTRGYGIFIENMLEAAE